MNAVQHPPTPLEEGFNDSRINEVFSPPQAALISSSTSHSAAIGAEEMQVSLEFKNSGQVPWTSYALNGVGVIATSSTSTMEQIIADSSWVNSTTVKRGNVSVAPGRSLKFNFKARAPIKLGEYVLRYQLKVNGQDVVGGLIEFPLSVIMDADPSYQLPAFATRALVSEPLIRVGLYKPTGEVQFQSEFIYQVYSGQESRGFLEPGTRAKLKYRGGQYSFQGGGMEFESRGFIRLVPMDQSYYFTLVNYNRRLAGRRNINFNKYRGGLDYRYSAKHKGVYVINELSLDAYTAGVTETSNDAPLEYIKALQVAARSYAYYKYNYHRRSNKIFHVTATTADQLYLGYNSELSMPRVASATQATYGEMVTYNGGPVVTPYFSRTNGRTLSWQEGWAGSSVPMPWLVSVEAKYDKGLTKRGHGVGMSMRDASLRASRDRLTYAELLRYYYRGTEVERVY